MAAVRLACLRTNSRARNLHSGIWVELLRRALHLVLRRIPVILRCLAQSIALPRTVLLLLQVLASPGFHFRASGLRFWNLPVLNGRGAEDVDDAFS